jgi:hypothetical protein
MPCRSRGCPQSGRRSLGQHQQWARSVYRRRGVLRGFAPAGIQMAKWALSQMAQPEGFNSKPAKRAIFPKSGNSSRSRIPMARDVSVKTSRALSASLFLSPAKAASGTISRHNLCDSRMVRGSLIVYAPDEKPLAGIAVPHGRRNARLIAALSRLRMGIRFGIHCSQACGCVVCTRFGLSGYLNTVVARRSLAGNSSPAACD